MLTYLPEACIASSGGSSLTLWTGFLGAATGFVALVFQWWKHYFDATLRLDIRARLFFTHDGRPSGPLWVAEIVVTNRSQFTALLDGALVYGVVLTEDPVAGSVLAYQQSRDPTLRGLRRPTGSWDSLSSADPIRLERGDTKVFQIPLDRSKKDVVDRVSGEYWGVAVTTRDGRRFDIDGDALLRRVWTASPLLKWLPRKWRLRRWYVSNRWPDEPLRSVRIPARAVVIETTTFAANE